MGLTLVVMAAGASRRFGGDKQVAAVDARGQALLDYSVFDAVGAGFDRVVFVVRPDSVDAFDAAVGRRIARHAEVRYAAQGLDAVPDGFEVPAGRAKPWGTGHAVLCALPLVEGDFLVVNADDFYGRTAYRRMARFLRDAGGEHAMVAYKLANTTSPNGTVSRGVCEVEGGLLAGIVEHTAIREVPGGFESEFGPLEADAPVSLNFWGFRAGARAKFERGFADFLVEDMPRDPLGAEFYLPTVAAGLVADPGIRVLTTPDNWLGMTYAADLGLVREHLAALVARGDYPEALWP